MKNAKPAGVHLNSVQLWNFLGQAAGEKATDGLVSVIKDEEDLEVREHAIFALSQRDEEEAVMALMGIATTNLEPRLRKRVIFSLGQRADDDPRVVALFAPILLGRRRGA